MNQLVLSSFLFFPFSHSLSLSLSLLLFFLSLLDACVVGRHWQQVASQQATRWSSAVKASRSYHLRCFAAGISFPTEIQKEVTSRVSHLSNLPPSLQAIPALLTRDPVVVAAETGSRIPMTLPLSHSFASPTMLDSISLAPRVQVAKRWLTCCRLCNGCSTTRVPARLSTSRNLPCCAVQRRMPCNPGLIQIHTQ